MSERIFREQCVGVWWEIGSVRWFYTQTLFHTGDILELRRRKAEYLRDALERGDLYSAVNLRIGFSIFPALADDEPERARREIADGMALWTKADFHVEHHHEMIGHVFADLYEARGVRALARVTETRRLFARSLLKRIQMVRIEFLYLRARAQLAAIVETGDASALGAVERDARAIGREHAPWAAPVASALHAAIAWQRGKDDVARTKLRDAVRGFEASDMGISLAAARVTLAAVSSDEAAKRDGEAAEAWMRAQSIREPSRVARMIAPGFERR